nr:MAG TPA: hypothetical protein [Caudoviricetes sp.]
MYNLYIICILLVYYVSKSTPFFLILDMKKPRK